MKPGNFILDLLRTYGHAGTSARNMMASARMFSFSENVVRVTLSRLAAKGLIENISRGQYRLAPGSDPVNDFVEEWRLGEERRRDWAGGFITLYSDKAGDRQQWALTATGFRPLGDRLWARPDNLRRTGTALSRWLIQLGVSHEAIVCEQCELSDVVTSDLRSAYAIEQLQAQYIDLREQLRQSAATLEDMSHTDAMKESFSLGGKVLQVLAKDPCLPEQWMPSGERQSLWQAMLAYDELGRQVWSGEPGSLPSPSISYA